MMRAPKGLEGVIVASTQLTKIDGNAGRLIYRGYDAPELAMNVSYESVAHLLWFGQLPTESQLSELKAKFVANRSLPEVVQEFLETASKAAEPLSVLQTSVSLLGGLEANKKSSMMEASIALTARLPVIVAAYHRFRHGLKPLESRSDLGHAANYLYLLTGKIPEPQHEAALNAYFILLADHGLGASTFVARVAASTLTDVHSSVVAAISALKGPLHGGAPIFVWDMLRSIGTAEQAAPWLKDLVDRGERIMGFGHRVYRTEDPRSKVLKKLAQQTADEKLYSLADTVETEARQLLRTEHPERPLDTNVEFYSALVLQAVGIPPELFTSTFACARTVGWTAHIIEQLRDNRLFRPEAEYTGPSSLPLHNTPEAPTVS